MERYAAKKASCVEFDEKLAMYSKLSREIQNLPTEKDVNFIRISSAPLNKYVQAEASAWVMAYGTFFSSRR